MYNCVIISFPIKENRNRYHVKHSKKQRHINCTYSAVYRYIVYYFIGGKIFKPPCQNKDFNPTRPQGGSQSLRLNFRTSKQGIKLGYDHDYFFRTHGITDAGHFSTQAVVKTLVRADHGCMGVGFHYKLPGSIPQIFAEPCVIQQYP